MEVGKSEIKHLSLHRRHQNDSCIKVGSDESYFNVSLIVRDEVTRQSPQTTIFEEKGEPKWIRTEVPLLTIPLTRKHGDQSSGFSGGNLLHFVTF